MSSIALVLALSLSERKLVKKEISSTQATSVLIGDIPNDSGHRECYQNIGLLYTKSRGVNGDSVLLKFPV